MSKNGGKIMFAGLLGALAGAVGGLLFAPKSGKKTREDILELANKIAVELKSEAKEKEKMVKEIYGKTSAEAIQKFDMVKVAVADRLAAVKSAGEKIDKEKYATVVEDVAKEFKEELENTKGNYSKLVSFLKSDWEKVKKVVTDEVLAPIAAKPKKTVKKTTKRKVAKK